MKKHLLIFALMIFSSSLFAQLTFGPKIGWNANTLTTDLATITDEMKASEVNFGVFARLGKKYYIQPEINFMKVESDFDTKLQMDLDNPIEATQTLTLKTLEVPVLIGTRLVDTKLANVRVFAGPVATLLLDKKMSITKKLDGTEAQYGEEDPVFTEENFKSAAWNLSLGAGVDVLMFTLDVRYSLGLTNLTTDDVKSLKNNGFMVSLGWKIL